MYSSAIKVIANNVACVALGAWLAYLAIEYNSVFAGIGVVFCLFGIEGSKD
jgi:hypothetical protein